MCYLVENTSVESQQDTKVKGALLPEEVTGLYLLEKLSFVRFMYTCIHTCMHIHTCICNWFHIYMSLFHVKPTIAKRQNLSYLIFLHQIR